MDERTADKIINATHWPRTMAVAALAALAVYLVFAALGELKGFRYIGSGEDVRYNKEKSPIEHDSRLIEGIGEVVNVAIRPESVSFNIYEPEVLTVRVRNAQAVASQRALFEVLWQAAK